LAKETSTDWPCFETPILKYEITEGRTTRKSKRFQTQHALVSDDGYGALKRGSGLQRRMETQRKDAINLKPALPQNVLNGVVSVRDLR